jgi:Cu-processing system permease protein
MTAHLRTPSGAPAPTPPPERERPPVAPRPAGVGRVGARVPRLTVLTLAGKEIREGFRNRWVLATTLLLAALALTLALLGSAPTGSVGASRLDVVTVSLASLTIFLVPLIALLLSHDAIAGEAERGTLLLLLSYPVGRTAVVLGKFLGQLAILAFATLLGYSVAALAVGWDLGAAAWSAFAAMVGASILLGAVFLALGLLASTVVRQRSTAGGIAIGLWLFFVILYDMAFLGLLVASGGHSLPPLLIDTLLALNPADAYRLLTLGAGGAGGLTGIGALAEHTALRPPVLVAVLVAWIAAPLGLAALVFARREL